MGKVQVIGSGQTAEVQKVECTEFKQLGGYSSAMELKNLVTASAALSGATSLITAALPADAIILAVDTVVTTAITGSGVTGYTVGDGTTANLWGAVTGIAVGTKTGMADYASLTGQVPLFKLTAANVTLTATGGTFTGGVVQASVWYLQSTGPRTI